MVVSEFGASDPRTVNAFDRISDVSDAEIMLLVVDPASPHNGETADMASGEAA